MDHTDLHGKPYFDFYKHVRGFDPCAKGQWQADYAFMLRRVFGLHSAQRLLDVGAAAGAQASAMLDAGLDAWAIEPEEYFVQQSPFLNLRGRILVAGAQAVPFRDAHFDFIHSHQVFEHIPADECWAMLAELHRVARSGAVLYVSLQLAGGPHDPADDVTHINYQTLDWWHARLFSVGWQVTADFDQALAAEKMQQTYNWDYFVARRA